MNKEDISKTIKQVKSLQLELDLLNTKKSLYNSALPVKGEALNQFVELPDKPEEWKMWGQPVEKVKKILKLFDLKNTFPKSIKDFTVPDPDMAKKKNQELVNKLKTADQVGIYSAGKLLMLVEKGKINIK